MPAVGFAGQPLGVVATVAVVLQPLVVVAAQPVAADSVELFANQ